MGWRPWVRISALDPTRRASDIIHNVDSIIQFGSDSLLYVLNIYKFVTINTFNCYDTANSGGHPLKCRGT